MNNVCTQNWGEMKASEQARFCEVCQKNVYDLTGLSQKNILNKLKVEKDLCGRIKHSQIEEINSSSPIQALPSKLFWAVGFTSLLSIMGPAMAQSNPSKIEVLEPNEKEATYPFPSQPKFVISGVVTDDIGLELPGVEIILKNSNISTSSDFYGKFSMEIPTDLNHAVLIFKTILYLDQEIEITDANTTLNVSMLEDPEMEEVIMVGGVTWKRNIFQKIGHFFKNLVGNKSCDQ